MIPLIDPGRMGSPFSPSTNQWCTFDCTIETEVSRIVSAMLPRRFLQLGCALHKAHATSDAQNRNRDMVRACKFTLSDYKSQSFRVVLHV